MKSKMLKTRLIICLWIFGALATAIPLNLTDVNDPQSNQLFNQLVTVRWPTPKEKIQAATQAMSALLVYMMPSITLLPGYAGFFAGNCSVFFNTAAL